MLAAVERGQGARGDLTSGANHPTLPGRGAGKRWVATTHLLTLGGRHPKFRDLNQSAP